MIRLQRNSRLVKYAYFVGGSPMVDVYRTSLCAVFWRCVGTTAMFALAAISAIVFIVAMVLHPLKAGGIVAVIVAGLGGGWLASLVSDRLKRRRQRPPSPPSLLRQMAKAAKDRVCPLVEIQP